MKTLNRMVGGSHYKNHFKIEPYEFISANKLDFATGNIIKYICRFKFKNGLEDLKKAAHNLEILMEQEYNYAEDNKQPEQNERTCECGSKNLIYISGPMRGYPQLNFLAFFHAETILTMNGWRCINPARTSWEMAVKKGCTFDEITYEEFMKVDLENVKKVNAMFMLDGWTTSEGAQDEYNCFIFENDNPPPEDDDIFYQADGYPKYNT
jgi:hypothetical protein